MGDERTRTGSAVRETVVRAPNHLGDVVMALPALVAFGADTMVVRRLAPVLEMAGVPGAVLPFDRGPVGFARAVRLLRRRGYRRGVLLSAAFSAAWLFRCGGVRQLRGTGTDGRAWLLRDVIDAEELRGRHRVEGFRHLVGEGALRREGAGVREAAPPRDEAGEGERAVAGRRPPPPDEAVAGEAPGPARLTPPPERVSAWRARIDDGPSPTAGPAATGVAHPAPAASSRLVALFPGANAPARRWPVERFAEAARAIVARGDRVVVLGGGAERPLTALVAASAPGAVDLGGRTDIVDLAAVLSLCDLVVTNDTGPMHLAGAVGTPTVSLWGSSDPREVRQTGSGDTPVSGAALPCKPCYRNRCHRRGRGTLLTDAHEECMRLIDVADVVVAVEATLDGRGADE